MKLSEDGCTLVRVDPAEIPLGGCFKIQDSINKIGNDAFQGCTNLTQIILAESLTQIGSGAFQGCTGLTEVTLPGKLIQLESRAFLGCTSLKHVSFPEGFVKVGLCAFRSCTSLTDIIFPRSLTHVSDGALQGCTSLTEVSFPKGVTHIGLRLFWGCKNLTQATFPESLVQIGVETFKDCAELKRIVVDTQDNAVFNRIKALFSQNERSRVIQKNIYNQVEAFRQEALEHVCRAPAINPLLGAIPFFRTTDEDCKLSIINNSNIIFNMNQYIGRDSEVYRAVEDEMLALALPQDALELEDYKNNLASIVLAHKPRKKEAIDMRQAAEAEDDTAGSTFKI